MDIRSLLESIAAPQEVKAEEVETPTELQESVEAETPINLQEELQMIKESCDTYKEYAESLEEFIMENKLKVSQLDESVPETNDDLDAIKYPQIENMSYNDAHEEMQRLGDKVNDGQGGVDDILRLQKMGDYKAKVLEIQKAERARRKAWHLKNPGVSKPGKYPYPFSGDNRRPRRSKWA